MEATTLNKLVRVTEALRMIDPEMPMQIALILLLIARSGEDGINMKDLALFTGLGKSSVSRNVAWLVQGKDPKAKSGPGLVEYFEDPDDRRNKVCRLTAAGERFVSTLVGLIEA